MLIKSYFLNENFKEKINVFTMNEKNKPQEQTYGQNRPILETQITKSKDGRYIIHKTVITDIKPVKYFQKVLEGEK